MKVRIKKGVKPYGGKIFDAERVGNHILINVQQRKYCPIDMSLSITYELDEVEVIKEPIDKFVDSLFTTEGR